MASRVVAVAGTCLIAACSPYGGGAFVCTSSNDCGGGICEPNGYCAFSDDTCPSGQKYGELSGPMSNECVPAGSGSGGPKDAGETDAPPQPEPDASRFCYGTGLVTACFAAKPTGALPLPSAIDTDTYACADVLGTAPGCVIAADSITSSGTVAVTGSKPLVLIAVTTITVGGTLDVASHRGGQLGAGADATECNAGTAPSGAHDGGAGGSFGGTGGNGAGGGGKGLAGAIVAATSFHGGCPGQDGGGTGHGGKGHGGGAVALIADTSITITGAIDASGAGATGAQSNEAGGGGAGAGGMIVLDSPAVSAGNVFANGGGGGEGGNAIGGPGADGSDPTSPLTQANGGNVSMTGGDGGKGAAGATTSGSPGGPGNTGGGNGGGGGGIGVVKLYRASAISGGAVSPSPG